MRCKNDDKTEGYYSNINDIQLRFRSKLRKLALKSNKCYSLIPSILSVLGKIQAENYSTSTLSWLYMAQIVSVSAESAEIQVMGFLSAPPAQQGSSSVCCGWATELTLTCC